MVITPDLLQRDADWIKTMSWDFPGVETPEELETAVGDLRHFLTLPAAEPMPPALRAKVLLYLATGQPAQFINDRHDARGRFAPKGGTSGGTREDQLKRIEEYDNQNIESMAFVRELALPGGKAPAGPALSARGKFINNYFGSDSSFMVNKVLRGDHSNISRLDWVKKRTADLVKAAPAASVALPEAVVGRRVMSFKEGVPATWAKGAVITDKGFTSMTLSDRQAAYHRSRVTGKGTVVTMEIEVPKGTKVIPNASEAELVLLPGSRLEITGRRGNTFVTRLVTE
jgi:hypothetical protein